MNKSLLEYPRHSCDGTRDKRYSVTPAHMGYSHTLLAVSFCDTLIGAARDEIKANLIMQKHWEARQAVLEWKSA